MSIGLDLVKKMSQYGSFLTNNLKLNFKHNVFKKNDIRLNFNSYGKYHLF